MAGTIRVTRCFLVAGALVGCLVIEQAGALTLGDLQMTPEVREQWSVILKAAKLSIAPENIELPTKPVSTFGTPFRVFQREMFELQSRNFGMTVHPQTGEPLFWAEYRGLRGPATPSRSRDEVLARTEALAAALLPPATERVLLIGPEYSESNGAWNTGWRRLHNGVPFLNDAHFISVYDSDLSLRAVIRGGDTFLPEDMTVSITPEEAREIAVQTAATLQKSGLELDETPDAVAEEDPKLVIAPYCPDFKDNGECPMDPREGTRLAWKVTVSFPESPDEEPRKWPWMDVEIWVDAKTGEVVGGG